VTFFMTDTQPFTIQERLIAYVWFYDRRRPISDSKNLHVMSEGRMDVRCLICACLLNIFPSVRSCHEFPLYQGAN
jgi:hypothetical protein